MKSKSIKGKSTQEIKTALAESMAYKYQPTLAICFISKKLDRLSITHLLDAVGISVFGCTTMVSLLMKNRKKVLQLFFY